MARKIHKHKVDLYIISQVKKWRAELGYTQEDIAIHLNVSTGYIGHIESPYFTAKYNNIQLNELAKFFKCSPLEFYSKDPL